MIKLTQKYEEIERKIKLTQKTFILQTTKTFEQPSAAKDRD